MDCIFTNTYKLPNLNCVPDVQISKKEYISGISNFFGDFTSHFLSIIIYLTMLITDNYWVALCLTVLTMLTWGTNKIAVKYLTYPVSLYTIDFFTWVFIFHIILGFTLGADWFPPEKGIGMISNFKDIFAHCTVELIVVLHRRKRPCSSSLVVSF